MALIDKARDEYEQGHDRQALKVLQEALADALRRNDLETIRAVRSLAASVGARTKNFSDRIDVEALVRRADKVIPAPDKVIPAPETARVAPTSAAEVSEARSSEIKGWVSGCVAAFGVAAGLSALGGLIVFFDELGSAPLSAVLGLVVGAVAAAVWIGMGVGLVLLSDIASTMRELAQHASAGS